MKYYYSHKTKLENIDASKLASQFTQDLFISAYNESERVRFVFDNVGCNKKHWLIFPEYDFKPLEIGALFGDVFDYSTKNSDEAEIITSYLDSQSGYFISGASICIDITGFIRPYLIFLIRALQFRGVNRIQLIYTEPVNYSKKEETTFSDDFIEIREVMGCGNSHNPDTSNDLLIVASGYDFRMISKIGKAKSEARKVQVLGFPSLKADMFQENVLKVYEAQEDISQGDFTIDDEDIILAPANDPFVTASLISEFVKKENKIKPITNIYLCPLSTKAQTLGLTLFYICEAEGKPYSILYPFSQRYSRETTHGIANILVYDIDFDLLFSS